MPPAIYHSLAEIPDSPGEPTVPQDHGVVTPTHLLPRIPLSVEEAQAAVAMAAVQQVQQAQQAQQAYRPMAPMPGPMVAAPAAAAPPQMVAPLPMQRAVGPAYQPAPGYQLQPTQAPVQPLAPAAPLPMVRHVSPAAGPPAAAQAAPAPAIDIGSALAALTAAGVFNPGALPAAPAPAPAAPAPAPAPAPMRAATHAAPPPLQQAPARAIGFPGPVEQQQTYGGGWQQQQHQPPQHQPSQQQQQQREQQQQQQQREPPRARTRTRSALGAPLCRHFNTPSGCWRGAECRFSHDVASAAAGAPASASAVAALASGAGGAPVPRAPLAGGQQFKRWVGLHGK